MHEIGHMVVRSGVLEPGERDAIVEAYTRANNKTKDRIEKLYAGKYADHYRRSKRRPVSTGVVSSLWLAYSRTCSKRTY